MACRGIPLAARFLLSLLIVSVSLPTRYFIKGGLVKEKTLAMIKPDGVSGNYTDWIKQVILDSGFKIFQEMITQLDKKTASRFYAEHSSKSFFSDLIRYMTSGPVVVMVLEKENAVAEWRALIGPTDAQKAKISDPLSIRAVCGLNLQKNCVHGSDSTQSATREISFFFKAVSSGELATEHDEL